MAAQRVVAGVIVVLLLAPGSPAQTIRQAVSRHAAAAAAAAEADEKRPGDGYRAVGSLIMAAGGIALVLAIANGDDGQPVCAIWQDNCDNSTGAYVQSLVIVGAGIALFAVGEREASVTSVAATRGGLVIQQRVKF